MSIKLHIPRKTDKYFKLNFLYYTVKFATIPTVKKYNEK